jgi:integrase/recombinase XerD
VVAPDCVGDQDETLKRLARYHHELQQLAQLGAQVLIPLQVGTRTHEEFYAEATAVAGVPLAAPDRSTKQGFRDHALLLFLYNSGARVSEAASLRIGDLNLRPNQIGSVQLRGKGRKIRRCPLWPTTVNVLLALTRNRLPEEPVFLNRLGQAITRHGVHRMLRNHVRTASTSHPSLLRRTISPHTIRHTTATHLLRSGVDINTIRAWLGHVSIDTTNVYAEVDLQRKAEVLAHTDALRTPPTKSKHWKEDPSLLSFLRSL